MQVEFEGPNRSDFAHMPFLCRCAGIKRVGCEMAGRDGKKYIAIDWVSECFYVREFYKTVRSGEVKLRQQRVTNQIMPFSSHLCGLVCGLPR